MALGKNLLECAYYWEQTTPDRVCYTQPMGGGDANVRVWTFSEMMDEARRMAAYLKSLSFPDKSQVAFCSKNCAYWIMCDLAIWMAGHVSVPLFPTLTADTVKYILEHSESKLLFVGKLDPVWDVMKPGVPASLPQVAFPLAPATNHTQWDDIVKQHEPLPEPVDRDPNEMATIIYTSGSTGLPKGAMHSFGAMHASAAGMTDFLKARPEDRMLSYLPLAHSFERFLVQSVHLYSGLALWFAESLDTFVADLQRARPTLFISVPRLWLKFQLGVFQKMPAKKLDRLLRIPILRSIVKKKVLTALGLDHCRFAGSGSAPIPAEVIEWYRRLGLELLEGYGMTENFAYSHANKPGIVKPGTVGIPYPDCDHKISDDGEILAKSPGTMMGYFKSPEKSQQAFTADGWLRTGDKGQIDELGRLTITGRVKEIFKTSKGKYVAPAPIENEIINHPLVEMCSVTGSGRPQPFAVIMLSEKAQQLLQVGDKKSIEQELTQFLSKVNAGLPAYEKLQFFALIDDEWLPENGFLTPTLKVKRAKIEDAYGPLADAWYEEKKPVIWKS